MFVKNQFSAVRAELSAAHAKAIPRGASPGWTVRSAAAGAPPALVLNRIPSDQSTDHDQQRGGRVTVSQSKGFSRTFPVYPTQQKTQYS